LGLSSCATTSSIGLAVVDATVVAGGRRASRDAPLSDRRRRAAEEHRSAQMIVVGPAVKAHLGDDPGLDPGRGRVLLGHLG
jgi:hypothetical protein